MSIRSYGPGKFDTIVDGYVYESTLDGGADEECGDVQSTGWFGLVHLGRDGLKHIFSIAKHENDKLTLEEAKLIRSHAGAIISENDQGFVGVEYFKTKKALEKAWKRIEKACEGAGDYY